MVRCPVCESARVVIVLSPTRKAFCVRCGSRWIQEGSYQHAVRPNGAHPSGGPTTPLHPVPDATVS
jgi:Zn-finger nucleic acid-binding protein